MRYAKVCCNPYIIKLFLAKWAPHFLEKGYISFNTIERTDDRTKGNDAIALLSQV
ncbi:MAG: hypothetical protein ACM65M_05370 [Microcoleus sp.]